MEQPMTGGSEARPDARSAGQRDHERIRRGLEEAERENRPIDHATARHIALQLHGGQDSPLLRLASCGAIREDGADEDAGPGVRSLADEMAECRQYFGEAIEPWVEAIETYAAGRDDKGPLDDWLQLTAPEQPTAELPERRVDERQRIVTPRIYVASLADYNHGVLHGRWIEAEQDVVDIQAEVQAMLARSKQPVAEDWAIHDYEGFGAFQVGEYESLAAVSAVALGIAECGQAFAAYASWAGTDEDSLRRFGEAYVGHWPDLESYARDLAADLGWEQEIQRLPEGLRPYVDIDYAQLARDLRCEVTTVDGSSGIYIFRDL